MVVLHAKSPCCGAAVRRYGGRRRQCAACRRTWSIRAARRGPKRRRSRPEFLLRYLRHEVPPIDAIARMRGVGRAALQRRLMRSLAVFTARTPWPQLPPSGDLICIADAMVRTIERRWYTLYVVLLRPVNDQEATIAKPLLRPGKEVAAGWNEALDQLPEDVRKRIHALVSDGHVGLLSYAMWSRWLIQRCHFHLIASIQGRRSRWIRSRHQEEGERVYRLVTEVLTAPIDSDLKPIFVEIETIAWNTRSRQLRGILLGFLTHADDYRTHLRHPELRLPTTNNAAESVISSVRELCHRARGFRTLDAFTRWLEALVKARRTVKCNPNSQQK